MKRKATHTSKPGPIKMTPKAKVHGVKGTLAPELKAAHPKKGDY